MSKGFVVSARDGAILNFRVSPGASRTSIDGAYSEDAIKLRLAALPFDGKANAEAERYVAKLFGVAKPDVTVVRGAAAEEVREILSRRLP